MTYESLDTADERLMDVAIMFGMVALLKVCYTVALWRKVEASDSPDDVSPAITTSTSTPAVASATE